MNPQGKKDVPRVRYGRSAAVVPTARCDVGFIYIYIYIHFFLLLLVSVYKVPFLKLVSVYAECPFADTGNINLHSYIMSLPAARAPDLLPGLAVPCRAGEGCTFRV